MWMFNDVAFARFGAVTGGQLESDRRKARRAASPKSGQGLSKSVVWPRRMWRHQLPGPQKLRQESGGRPYPSFWQCHEMPNRSWPMMTYVCVHNLYNASLWFLTWCFGPGALYRFRAGSEGVRGDFVNFCTKHIEDHFLSIRQSRDDGLVSLGDNLDNINIYQYHFLKKDNKCVS